jgi:hypothetical protein
MNAKSIKGGNFEEIKNAFQQGLADGFNPTLAIVFLSIGTDPADITSMLEEKSVAIFGAITPGDFTGDGEQSAYGSILLLDINPAYFSIILEDFNDSSEEATFAVAGKMAQAGLQVFEKPAFILLSSNLRSSGEALVAGMVSVLGDDAVLIGGVSAHVSMYETGVVFSTTRQVQYGIASLVIDQDKIAVEGIAVSGWKPVGTPKIVTKSEGSWVITIDDEPALDMLMKFTGMGINLDDSRDLYNQIGISFPLQVTRPTGSPIMKPPLLFNRETRAVFCGGQVPEGSEIRFSLPPDFDVVDTVVNSAVQLRNEKLANADAMILFSCVGRLVNLGPLVEQEIKGLQEVWNVPLIGFFSLGEFGTPLGGRADFHGTTCSWVVLKER